jgi:hypothetical protein
MSDNSNIDLSHITLDGFIDTAILSHGFMPYKRDYYFHVETLWREPLAGQYLVLFRHCYEFNYKTFTGPETLLQSWDDVFIDYDKYEKAGGPEGYVWGSNHIGVYPGFTLVDNSSKASEWSEKLGKQMKEVELEADIFKMNFVFHNWTIKKLNDKTNLISQFVFPFGE